jgi:hypothetical protein
MSFPPEMLDLRHQDGFQDIYRGSFHDPRINPRRPLPDEQQYLAPLEQLVAAEALRQLGEFELATAILSKPFPPEYDTALSRLLGLCAQRNSMLQKL